MLQRYGISVGIRMLARGRLQRGLRYLIVPVNYWRQLEFRLALQEGAFGPGDRVLDVGSPKLLSLYIAERTGATVFATDIDDYFVTEYELLRSLRGIPPERLQVGVEDGRRLSFQEGAFDKVYSISVLEHIPDDGDAECIREMGRVLAPRGRCIITVPFWPTSRTDWRGPDFYWSQSSVAGAGGKVFFQRRYSACDLEERLIRPSGLTVAKLAFVGEKVMAGSNREFCEYLPPVVGPIQPLLSRLLLTKPADDWRKLSKPLCALIVLEKPGVAGESRTEDRTDIGEEMMSWLS